MCFSKTTFLFFVSFFRAAGFGNGAGTLGALMASTQASNTRGSEKVLNNLERPTSGRPRPTSGLRPAVIYVSRADIWADNTNQQKTDQGPTKGRQGGSIQKQLF